MKKYLWIGGGVILVIGLLFGGYSFYQKVTKSESSLKTVTEERDKYKKESETLTKTVTDLNQTVKYQENRLALVKKDAARNITRKKYDPATGHLIEDTSIASTSASVSSEETSKLVDQVTQLKIDNLQLSAEKEEATKKAKEWQEAYAKLYESETSRKGDIAIEGAGAFGLSDGKFRAQGGVSARVFDVFGWGVRLGAFVQE